MSEERAPRSNNLVGVERNGSIATIRLNHPKVNALSTALLNELYTAVEQLVLDPPGALIVTGSDRFFAAGADVKEIADEKTVNGIIEAFSNAFDAVASFPRITIAAVSGYALGGGFELALSCDFRIASTRAVFGLPELELGIMPGAGGTQRLTRIVGVAAAKDLVLSSRRINAEEALSLGLVSKVVEQDDLLDAAETIARAFADGPVFAQMCAKRAVEAAFDGSLEQGLQFEREMFFKVRSTQDAQRGIESFLNDGPGKATFQGN